MMFASCYKRFAQSQAARRLLLASKGTGSPFQQANNELGIALARRPQTTAAAAALATSATEQQNQRTQAAAAAMAALLAMTTAAATGTTKCEEQPTRKKKKTTKKKKKKTKKQEEHWHLTPADVATENFEEVQKSHDIDSMPEYTSEQVSENNGENGTPIWMSYGGVVYDVTNFIPNHPGGHEKILTAAGQVCYQVISLLIQ